MSAMRFPPAISASRSKKISSQLGVPATAVIPVSSERSAKRSIFVSQSAMPSSSRGGK